MKSLDNGTDRIAIYISTYISKNGHQGMMIIPESGGCSSAFSYFLQGKYVLGAGRIV